MLTPVIDFCRKHPEVCRTPNRAYQLARENFFPVGVFVRIGRRLFVNEEKYQKFVEAGGSALPGGWRREAA